MSDLTRGGKRNSLSESMRDGHLVNSWVAEAKLAPDCATEQKLSDLILRYVGHNFALAHSTLSEVRGFDAICNLTVLIRRHEADHFIKVIRARVAFRKSDS
jgi:hypothetical protein